MRDRSRRPKRDRATLTSVGRAPTTAPHNDDARRCEGRLESNSLTVFPTLTRRRWTRACVIMAASARGARAPLAAGKGFSRETSVRNARRAVVPARRAVGGTRKTASVGSEANSVTRGVRARADGRDGLEARGTSSVAAAAPSAPRPPTPRRPGPPQSSSTTTRGGSSPPRWASTPT